MKVIRKKCKYISLSLAATTAAKTLYQCIFFLRPKIWRTRSKCGTRPLQSSIDLEMETVRVFCLYVCVQILCLCVCVSRRKRKWEIGISWRVNQIRDPISYGCYCFVCVCVCESLASNTVNHQPDPKYLAPINKKQIHRQ